MERTRSTLLEAALDLFAEKGISGTRVQDVTERADVAKGAFYNYFPSKSALVADLLSASIALLERRYPEPSAVPHSIADRVAALSELQETFFSENPMRLMLFHHARGLFLIRGSVHGEVRDVIASYLRRTGEFIVRDGLDDAGWSGEDLVRLGALVAGFTVGHRSYEVAAGVSSRPDAVRALVAGIAAFLERRAATEPGR